jgi:leucyl aminopeptidase
MFHVVNLSPRLTFWNVNKGVVVKITLVEDVAKKGILVVGLSFEDGKKPSLIIESGDLVLDTKPLLEILRTMGASGKADEVIKVPLAGFDLLVFTGLGKVSRKYPHEVLRRAAGAATRSLAGNESIAYSLPTHDIQSVRALAEGAALGSYNFETFKGRTKGHAKSIVTSVTIHTSFAKSSEAKSIPLRAKIIGNYTTLVRDLVNTPANHLHPVAFAETIKKLLTSAGGDKANLKISILNEKQLKAQGFGGIIGVGQGSSNPPRLVHISYTPKKSKKKFALVGKGITFDTGGLNLKPGLGMEAMKSDMAGAAAVCAATLAIAALKLPVTIHAWAPLAENMVSDTATRPGDILTTYGGKTVEVLNPDAEGRLILADALVKAAEESGLDGIIDVATLTGAQSIALGTRTSAVMTNNEEISQQFLAAAVESGEAFWPMPLPDEMRPSLESPVADLANMGENMGKMLVAGLFLKEFVPSDLPWLHLDIASPAYNDAGAFGYTPKGGTGVALRSLIQFIENASA